MKLVVMQPYIFPYFGYFQLIHHADRMVIYDDVNFINKGWINRNYILINRGAGLFTIPLKEASQNRLICEIEMMQDGKWRSKLLKTFELAYRKAPYFNQVYPVIEKVFAVPLTTIAAFNVTAIRLICEILGIDTELVESSAVYQNRHLKGQERILDICIREGADTYINPAGGRGIYDHAEFQAHSIDLKFIESGTLPYRQFNHEFVPNLSVIDCLMFNEPAVLQQKLGECVIGL